MAFDKLISMFKVIEEDDFDDDDDFEEIQRQPKKTESSNERIPRNTSERNERVSRPERNTSAPTRTYSDTSSDYRRERTERVERPVRQERPSKVVPIKSTRTGLEVSVAKPSSFEDSQEICDLLIEGKAVVANLEGFDSNEAQRIMDFISGCVYAMNGNLHQISKYIFIFSPDSIDISGDFLDTMSSQGFGVPTINREF